jgi:hypothetical protein
MENKKCESLKVVWRGKKDYRYQLYRCSGCPKLPFKWKSIALDGNDSDEVIAQCLNAAKPGKNGYSITFQNGACYKIVQNLELWNLYVNLSDYVGAIAIVMPVFPLVYHGEPEEPAVDRLLRVARALQGLFRCSGDSCVQLHIEGFNMNISIASVLGVAIRELPNLQSFFFEACRGSEESLAVLFRSLRGKLPKLRHLYLPELQAEELTNNNRNNPHLQPTWCLAEFLVGTVYPGCHDLVYLDVSFGEFGRRPFLRILDICRKNKSIEVLVLNGVGINHLFLTREVYRYMSDGSMPLLDIVFGNNEWRQFKNSMNHFFRLNKEKRERRPLLEYLESENASIALVPYALSALLKKYEGPNDVYHRLCIATDLKNVIIRHSGLLPIKRKRSTSRW